MLTTSSSLCLDNSRPSPCARRRAVDHAGLPLPQPARRIWPDIRPALSTVRAASMGCWTGPTWRDLSPGPRAQNLDRLGCFVMTLEPEFAQHSSRCARNKLRETPFDTIANQLLTRLGGPEILLQFL